jgi:glycosyltransferase involved in cell wall biosynthesis
LKPAGNPIAMIYHQFLVSPELGGAGRVALQLAAFLRRQGQECHAWIPGKGAAWQEAEKLGVPTHAYNGRLAMHRRTILSAAGNYRLARQLAKPRPGLVHIHAHLYYGAFSWGLRWSGLTRVVHVQLEQSDEGFRYALRHPPELVITCARFLVDQVRRALPEDRQNRQKIAAVPNAVDTQKFSPGDKVTAKARVGAPADVPLVLMLANLAPHKGQETTIRATAILKRRGVRVVCWLAGAERGGTQSYTERLRSFIAEMDVSDRVHLLGPRTDAPDLLRAADLFLLPSTHEGLPLSLVEAQATKVPVLAAPTAGVPEIVRHGETGLLIPADDAAAYADGMVQLLSHADLYHRVTEAAFAQVNREYNWRTYCQRIWELYEDLPANRLYRPVPKNSAKTFSQLVSCARNQSSSA